MFSEDMSEEDLSEDMYNIWKEDFDNMAKKKKKKGKKKNKKNKKKKKR